MKSKLALDEAHTYNPPHQKTCSGCCDGYRNWLGVFKSRRVGVHVARVLERPGWAFALH